MSYMVSIRRQNGRPIAVSELKALVQSDGQIRAEAPPGSGSDELFLIFQPSGDVSETRLLLEAGGINSTTTPSDLALLKMQEIARSLGSRLVGEEGEDLTDTDFQRGKPSAAVALGCLAVVVMVLALLAWWWFK